LQCPARFRIAKITNQDSQQEEGDVRRDDQEPLGMAYKERRTESNKDTIDSEIVSPASYVNTNLREAVEDNKRHSQVKQKVTGGASTLLVEQQEDEDETKFFLRFRIILIHNGVQYVDFYDHTILCSDLFPTLYSDSYL
jgi:hypothetical protein